VTGRSLIPEGDAPLGLYRLPGGHRLRLRHEALKHIRTFFWDRNYVEVETPIRVPSPGIDPYIDALPADTGYFLATSPELEMKKALTSGLTRIFQVTRAFREGERGALHHPEFSLLEWYTVGEDYRHLMEFTEDLVRELGAVMKAHDICPALSVWPRPFPRLTVDEVFRRYAGWTPSTAFEAEPFFDDLVNKVEPHLTRIKAVFLMDFPERVGAMARKKPDDPLVCERFELYLDGLEICNGFTELTDAEEQKQRFRRDNLDRVRLGKVPYPVDRRFLEALENGLPPCAGNALGIDRLLLALAGRRRLAEVTLLAD
jgi:lysyl-tRNA synthetase class 2